MKKIVSIALALIMVLTLASTVLAAPRHHHDRGPENFVQSPVGGSWIVTEDIDSGKHITDNYLALTSYSNRDALTEEQRVDLERGYRALRKLDVRVNDLFDLSVEGSETRRHPNSGKTFTVTMKCDDAADLDYILRWNGCEWEKITDFTVLNGTVTFTSTSGSFAFVLKPLEKVCPVCGKPLDKKCGHKEAAACAAAADAAACTTVKVSPQTDDYSVYFIAASALFALCAVSFLAVSKRKSFEK